MDMFDFKAKFDEIVKKYNLNDIDKATEISKFLTSGKKISVKEFSILFVMDETDAKLFLDFILMGLEFKESYIDK